MKTVQGRLLYTHHTPDTKVIAVDWSPDGTNIATGATDGSLLILDVLGGKLVWQKRDPAMGYCASAAWSPNGEEVVSSYQNGTVTICNGITGETLLSYQHSHESPVFDCAWSPDGELLATAGFDFVGNGQGETPSVRLRRVRRGTWLATFIPEEPFDETQQPYLHWGQPFLHPPFQVLCWSPDGTRLAMGQKYKMHIWQPAFHTPPLSHTSALYDGNAETFLAIDRMAWSPESRYLAFTVAKRIEVVDGTSGDPVACYHSYEGYGYISYLTWLPGGKRLLSMSENEVHVCDAFTGEEIAHSVLPLEQDVAIFYEASLSPDLTRVVITGGKYLAGGHTESFAWVCSHGLELS